MEEIQNSEVSFLTYSRSVSFLRRLRNSFTAYKRSVLDRSHLWANLTTAVAPLPMATFSQTPSIYFKFESMKAQN